MFIVGSMASKIGDFESTNCKCKYCNQESPQKLSIFGKYLHIFFIPMFPTGSKLVAECSNCFKTYKEKDFPPTLHALYEKNKFKTKRPFWHYLGLYLLGLFIAFIAFIIITDEEDPRSALLKADENLMVWAPSMESDSMSFKLKTLFDEFDAKMIPSQFKYRTKVSEDKALVLVQIPKLRSVEKEERVLFLKMIQMVIAQQAGFKDKDMYIGVKGISSMMLIKTPSYQENSLLASEGELLEFYGPGSE